MVEDIRWPMSLGSEKEGDQANGIVLIAGSATTSSAATVTDHQVAEPFGRNACLGWPIAPYPAE